MGCLPYSGGLYDQPPLVINKLKAVYRTQKIVREEQAKAAERKHGSKH